MFEGRDGVREDARSLWKNLASKRGSITNGWCWCPMQEMRADAALYVATKLKHVQRTQTLSPAREQEWLWDS